MVLTSRLNCMKPVMNEMCSISKDASINTIESILRSIDESYVQHATSFASQNIGLLQLKFLTPDDIVTNMRVPLGDALSICDALKRMNIFDIVGDDEYEDELQKLKKKNRDEKHQCRWRCRNS